MKVKNTFVKGKLNKDVDERLVPNGEYIHSENVMVSDSSTSDIGALENARGNEKLTELDLTNGVTIGSYADEFNQKIYWFVTSDDKDMVLEYNVEDDILEVLLESDNGLLNFDNSYLITGIVKIINGDPNRDLLLWTDDLNSPRVINIERAKTYGLNGFNQDTISLIKKPPRFAPPITPINIIKEVDSIEVETENNLENKFLSFAYRYKYLDGEYSALSSFTDYQFIPRPFDLDYNTLENNGMINSFNGLIINFNTGSELVTDIELVFKQSNSNNIYLIETINKENKGYGDGNPNGVPNESFTFSSNKIFRILPEDEIFRQYDNIPRKAKSLELIGNRLIFGNYVEGYDLKDNLNDPVNIDLEVSSITEDIKFVNVPYTIDETEITLDLSNVTLNKDYLFDISFRLDEDVISRIIYPTVQDLRDRTDTPQIYNDKTYNEVVYVTETGFYYQWIPRRLEADNGTTIINQTSTPQDPFLSPDYGRWIREVNYNDTSVLFDNSFQYFIDKDYSDVDDLLSSTGDGQFDKPNGVSINNDEVFVLDTTNNRVQVFSLNGVYLRQWGSFGTSNGQFDNPQGITTYNNEVFVVDTGNNRIQVFSINGDYSRGWGTLGTLNGEFDTPSDIFVYNDEIFVVDSNNNRIQVFDIVGFYDRQWGTLGTLDGEFDTPQGINVYDNEVFVVDTNNNRVQVFDLAGVYDRQWGTLGFADGGFNTPKKVFVYDNEVFITDTNNNRVQVFDLAGVYLRKWGTTGTADSQFDTPLGITVYNDEVFVVDTDNNRVQVFELDDNYLRKWGTSSAFKTFVEVYMTQKFFEQLQGETPEYSQTTNIKTGFVIVSNTATTLTIKSPTRDYTIDRTPLVPADPVNDVDVTASFIYDDLSKVVYSKTDSTKSLKSNRTYEVGVVYYDEYNRASSVLTNEDNTLYIPQESSASKNQLQIELKNKPPYWADRYKIAVKQNKNFDYHIIYCNVFYNDGLYRWIKIETDSKDKIAVGNLLIVKSDSSGVLGRLVKTKVLEIKDDISDIVPTAEDGLYIKIKPINFQLDAENLEFVTFSGSSRARYSPSARTSPSFLPYDLKAGSKVRVYISFSAGGGISFNNTYDENFIVTQDYLIADGGVKSWFMDNVATKNSFETYIRNSARSWGFAPDGSNFFATCIRDGIAAKRGRISTNIKFEILFSEGATVFETEATDSNNDVFYETEQTFEIIDNNHQGNIQNQDTSIPNTNAILRLNFFNCYIQGNGAESYRFKDAFNLGIDTNGNKITANYLNLDLRPTAKSIEDYKEVRRYADLTYSEPYNENSNVNGLNEFNLAKANYKEDIDKKYGFIQKLYSRDTDLLVFQENKVSKILFEKDVLFNADGTSNLSSIDKVLGQQDAYTGEYGISNNPESFAYNGFAIYFTDSRRGAVMRLAGDGLNEISEYGLTQFFKDQFRNTNNIKKIGGFDPYNDQYVLYTTNSLTDPSIDPAGHYTVSFEEGVKGWTSFHTFYPEYMVGINNDFYTFKNGDLYLHHSDNVDRCNFYGTTHPAKVSFSLNEAPSDIKELKAVSMEGNYAWDTTIQAHISNLDDFIESTIRQDEYVKKEGFWYAYARRNENPIQQDSKSSYGIGKIQTIVGNTITVNGYSDFLTSGDKLVKGSNFSIIGDIISSSKASNITTINLTTTTGLSIGDFVLGIKNPRIDGGNLRGYTMRFDLEITNPTKVELFAVNSEIFKSYP